MLQKTITVHECIDYEGMKSMMQTVRKSSSTATEGQGLPRDLLEEVEGFLPLRWKPKALQKWADDRPSFTVVGSTIFGDPQAPVSEICEALCNDVPADKLELEAPSGHIEHFLSCLRLAPHLKKLVLCEANIGDSGAAALAEAIRKMPKLRALHLGGNGIGPEGVAVLAAAFPALPNLHTVNLRNNRLGRQGVVEIIKTLPKMQGVKKVCLGSNQLTQQERNMTKELGKFRGVEITV